MSASAIKTTVQAQHHSPVLPDEEISPRDAGISQVLIELVSDLCGVDPAQIGSEFELATGKLNSSLGRARLDAKIRRRLKVTLRNLHNLRTFGDLEAAVAGFEMQADPAAAVASPPREKTTATPARVASPMSGFPAGMGMGCGVDIESVAALPEADDFREESFYTDNFTDTEMDYCLAQSNPRSHFAARWCAKEALKKCVPACLSLSMRQIEVALLASGAPQLRLHTNGHPQDLPVAVSMSHTDDYAVAFVIGSPVLPSAPARSESAKADHSPSPTSFNLF